jgi:hypothetical protein
MVELIAYSTNQHISLIEPLTSSSQLNKHRKTQCGPQSIRLLKHSFISILFSFQHHS